MKLFLQRATLGQNRKYTLYCFKFLSNIQRLKSPILKMN